ncbi:DNA-3-methyladenine glycosylase 2 family protein [Nocardioides zeae]|uniref:DNA-3-methyladenine glycosylase 2 family protein n=1 Tax=Nocardioides imazamoxiresistens TaxID=3231893 RepID=A0ABU3PUM9_9ACTN|nr:DNA-3-methyladenine glycosylase 2 family protein [Nocardioides zeae]MDT9592485.1 DNA-3-methyladenine glycosylase 2 family protein [Nocardioides zeae]
MHVSRTWRPGWPCPATAILAQQRHGGRDPSYAVAADGAHWRAFRTPEGPGTLRVAPRPSAGEVDLDAWGPGAAWLLDGAPALLGADDDPAGFEPRHAVVADLWRRFPAWRLGRSRLVLDALVPAVIEQKVTGQEAFAGYASLLRRFGDPAPGPTREERPGAPVLRVPPDPERLRSVPSWEWLRMPVDLARSSTVVRAARVADGLERTVREPGAAAEAALRSVRGIGVWTAAEVRRRTLGDPDAVSFGDYHVAKDVGWALTGEPVDDAGLAELLEEYRPHRARVTELVVLGRLGPPRRGPRMAPRRHLPR